MIYYVAESVYLETLPVSEQELREICIPLHEAHIQAAVDRGQVLLAGPKTETGGGLMVVRAESRTALDEFLNADPFVTRGIAHFVVREFKLINRAPEIQNW